MRDLLTLYYAPDNASLCVRLALEHLDRPYQTVLVDRRHKGQRDPAYLELNPNGLIPVMVTPDGPMFETGAILTWLAQSAPSSLMTPQDIEKKQFFLQWMFWLANTLHPALRMLFYAETYIDENEKALRHRTRARLNDMLGILQQAEHADWLDAEGPTAQGCYLAPMQIGRAHV